MSGYSKGDNWAYLGVLLVVFLLREDAKQVSVQGQNRSAFGREQKGKQKKNTQKKQKGRIKIW